MSPLRRKLTAAFLLFFTAWDLGLAALAVLWPDVWFRLFHGVPRVDPEHILARTGMVWLAFAFFHLAAWAWWRSNPHWLAIVGGMRLSEIFADVAWLLLAADMTTQGRIAFALAAPSNLFFAAFFIQGYLLTAQAEREELEEKVEAARAEVEQMKAEAEGVRKLALSLPIVGPEAAAAKAETAAAS